MRNHENMILTIQNVLKTGKIINGVKGMSPLVGFMHFDLVRSLANDYMHGVCLGVLKNQFDFWFNSNYNKEEYYIKPKQKRIINQRLREIKPCRFINRRITTMDNHSTFKASQCRNFILYFHPVLSGILKKKYFQHFQLLASSIYTLLKTEISCEELQIAEKKLKKFVSEYEILYGEIKMTMNVHCLLHLVECVRNLGPLWAHSMFVFESFIGTLKKYGDTSTNVINQVIERITIETQKTNKNVQKNASDILQDKITIVPSIADEVVLRQAKVHDRRKYHASMNRGQIKFTSLKYNLAKKTADYFIKTIDDEIGIVKYYIESNNVSYALIAVYSCERSIGHILMVKPTGKIILKPSQSIIEKFVYIHFSSSEFVVARPNPYEIN